MPIDSLCSEAVHFYGSSNYCACAERLEKKRTEVHPFTRKTATQIKLVNSNVILVIQNSI
jgi:hypothetical protein